MSSRALLCLLLLTACSATPGARDDAGLLRGRAREAALDGDPELVGLAGPFGDCPRARGFRAPSTRPYLDKEIADAEADLECGKAFHAALASRSHRVNADYGLPDS
ncbi:hypothetical protein ACIBG8_48230 [Nonomuraea sp. NPDC050556]|uniref:hypothetical protein n=1 Tax=Nonomuraea sp. NPDC050556 TaxID=3364369 RepID=UPI0037AC5799